MLEGAKSTGARVATIALAGAAICIGNGMPRKINRLVLLINAMDLHISFRIPPPFFIL
jgi:hypothetical protein